MGEPVEAIHFCAYPSVKSPCGSVDSYDPVSDNWGDVTCKSCLKAKKEGSDGGR